MNKIEFKYFVELIKNNPFSFALFLLIIYILLPSASPKLEIDGNFINVKDGFSYYAGKENRLEIYPFMLQKWMIGMPKKSGVNAALYYVTRDDLEKAKSVYSKNSGCWPSTFSSFKRELLLVGDHKNISRFIKREGPPNFYDNPAFIVLNGSRLNLKIDNEDAAVASEIAGLRNAEFYSIKNTYKLTSH